MSRKISETEEDWLAYDIAKKYGFEGLPLSEKQIRELVKDKEECELVLKSRKRLEKRLIEFIDKINSEDSDFKIIPIEGDWDPEEAEKMMREADAVAVEVYPGLRVNKELLDTEDGRRYVEKCIEHKKRKDEEHRLSIN